MGAGRGSARRARAAVAVTPSPGAAQYLTNHGVSCTVDLVKWKEWVESLGVSEMSPFRYYGVPGKTSAPMAKKSGVALLQEFFNDAVLSGALQMNVDPAKVKFFTLPGSRDVIIELITPEYRTAQWKFKGPFSTSTVGSLTQELRDFEELFAGEPFFSVPESGKVSQGKRVRVGDRVQIIEDEMGTVTEVNDPDQGDFEFYVDADDGTGSFWPGEDLEKI